MTENNVIPPVLPESEPELRRTKIDPKGVLQKNLKTFVYLGAALLVIAAAALQFDRKKTPTQQAAAKGQPPQPTLQDNTDNNVQDLKNQLKAQRDKDAQQQAAALVRHRSRACVSDARAAGCRRGLWADRRCRALHSESGESGPTLPASWLRSARIWAAGQPTAPALARTATGTAHRCQRTRKGRRIPLRLESRLRRNIGKATAGTGPDRSGPVFAGCPAAR
jgi:hypothetical protein